MVPLIAALALAADPLPGGAPQLMPVYGVSTDGREHEGGDQRDHSNLPGSEFPRP